METTPTSSVLTCTQCGAELHPDEGQIFLTCPFCDSTVYVDKSRVVFHWYVAPTLDEAKARASLARWMSGNQTVKDLDRKSSIVEVSFTYFPMWYFKIRHSRSGEEIRMLPAAATAVSEIGHLNLPAGDLRRYESELDAQAQTPTVPLQTALQWMGNGDDASANILEQSLVHIPLFTIKYSYQGRLYTALVEAATGGVFANIYPAKAEAPYLLAGGLTALVYLCLAFIPVFSGLAEGSQGAGIGFAICAVAGLAAAPALFALAAWVAAKV